MTAGAISYDVSLYLNGELIITDAELYFDLNTTQPLTIGYSSWFAKYSDGVIDEVRIYPLALTEEEVYHDMITPIAEFRKYNFLRSRYYNGSAFVGSQTTVEPYTRLTDNDPALVYANASYQGGAHRMSDLRVIHYLPGFQAYRLYCTISGDGTGSTWGYVGWEWSFLRNGIEVFSAKVEIWRNAVRQWYVKHSYTAPGGLTEASSNLINYTANTKADKAPVVVDAFVGPDNKHFTITVTAENETVAGEKYHFTWSNSLTDESGNPVTLEWFDGWVIFEQYAHDDRATGSIPYEIESHKGIWELFSGTFNFIVGGLFGTAETVATATTPLMTAVSEIFKPVTQIITSIADPMGAMINNAISGLEHAIFGTLGGLGQAIATALSPIVTAIVNVAGPIIQAVINFMNNILTAVVNTAVGFWTMIVNAIDGVLYALFPALGATSFSGFLTNITTYIGALFGWIVNSLTWMVTSFTAIFALLLVSLTKWLSIITTTVASWVDMIVFALSLISGGYGQTYDIFVALNLPVWITIGGIFYVVYLFALWDEQGIDAMLRHINMILNIFAFIINTLISVVQFFWDLITGIIEAIPIVE